MGHGQLGHRGFLPAFLSKHPCGVMQSKAASGSCPLLLRFLAVRLGQMPHLSVSVLSLWGYGEEYTRQCPCKGCASRVAPGAHGAERLENETDGPAGWLIPLAGNLVQQCCLGQ